LRQRASASTIRDISRMSQPLPPKLQDCLMSQPQRRTSSVDHGKRVLVRFSPRTKRCVGYLTLPECPQNLVASLYPVELPAICLRLWLQDGDGDAIRRPR
jgi:hypothetical protein